MLQQWDAVPHVRSGPPGVQETKLVRHFHTVLLRVPAVWDSVAFIKVKDYSSRDKYMRRERCSPDATVEFAVFCTGEAHDCVLLRERVV